MRVAHIAATAMTAGALVFLVLVALPALRAASIPDGDEAVARHCLRIAWVGLLAALPPGIAWVAIEIGEMSGLPLAEAVRDGMVPVVLTQTQFGIVADVRLALFAVLAAALWSAGASGFGRWLSLVCAAALLGLLA